jgi:magnesium chelatase subunit I
VLFRSVSDLQALVASTAGKIEMEAVGEQDENRVVEKLIQRATLNVFNRHFQPAAFDELTRNFENGLKIEVSDDMPSLEYIRQAAEVGGLSRAVEQLGAQGNPALVASTIEFALEGLHLNRKLNKDRVGGKFRYRG